MPISIPNVNATSDTFETWVSKTNQLATAMSTVVMTTALSTDGSVNAGNAYTNGVFAANTLVATQYLRGGTVATPGQLTITTNTHFSNVSNVSSNSTYLNLKAGAATVTATTLLLEGTTLNVTSNLNIKANTLSVVTSGRVGVNTNAPDAALTVVGGANVSGAIAGANTLTVTGTGTFSNTFVVTGNATFSNTVDVTGNVEFSNTLSVVGATTLSNTIAVTGGATLSNTLNVTGAVVVSNNLSVGGNVEITGTILINSGITLNAAAVATKITFNSGSSNGIFWPDNSYGGTGDTASITLQRNGGSGEDQRMVFTIGNETSDKFNFVAPSDDGLLMNGFTVWHSGNDGSASQLDAHYVDGFTQTSSATANTLVSRDSNGSFSANVMTGTATTARYADLAENYLADAEYPVGTVVVVGGEKEVTACIFGTLAIGAVSEKPAYLMNSELVGGTPIALKGRVPVFVTGVVRKGDRLIAGNTGTAIVGSTLSSDVFAVALETSNNPLTKLIECLIL